MATRTNVTTRAAVRESLKFSWLADRHPLHEEMDWLWEQNERRFEGGHQVRDEVWRYDWETTRTAAGSTRLRDGIGRDVILSDDQLFLPGEHYERRQDSAIYINFMEAFANDIVGHIFKQAPAPTAGLDFGTLGEVRRRQNIDTPTRAEMLYYNVNGIGLDGLQWDSYWAAELKLAMATGYRWEFVEASREPPGRQVRELQGFRPYLLSFSPRQVINWHYENGQLDWAVVKISARHPKVNAEGGLDGNKPSDEFLLLVRRGVGDLGGDFAQGGWWRFDSEKHPTGEEGTWAKTGGRIPMVPLIYDPHNHLLGRPGLTELGNAAIAMMNNQSAADFDAFDASGSVKALLNVGTTGFNLFLQKIKRGNRYAPLKADEDTPTKSAGIADATGGAVTADVFEKRVNGILRAVDRIQGNEVNSAPQQSGLAQQAGFTLGNVPRLSLVAGNLESCQNAVIPFFEMRWGSANPRGSARWTRKFELIKLTSSAQALLQLEAIAGINSDTLDTKVILAAAKDEGFVTDNADETKVEGELLASAKVRAAAALLASKPQPAPGVPGARKEAAPPEPARTNDPVKPQLDGPNIP